MKTTFHFRMRGTISPPCDFEDALWLPLVITRICWGLLGLAAPPCEHALSLCPHPNALGPANASHCCLWALLVFLHQSFIWHTKIEVAVGVIYLKFFKALSWVYPHYNLHVSPYVTSQLSSWLRMLRCWSPNNSSQIVRQRFAWLCVICDEQWWCDFSCVIMYSISERGGLPTQHAADSDTEYPVLHCRNGSRLQAGHRARRVGSCHFALELPSGFLSKVLKDRDWGLGVTGRGWNWLVSSRVSLRFSWIWLIHFLTLSSLVSSSLWSGDLNGLRNQVSARHLTMLCQWHYL